MKRFFLFAVAAVIIFAGYRQTIFADPTDYSFTTGPGGVVVGGGTNLTSGSVPVVRTGPVSNISGHSANVAAIVQTDGSSTNVWIEYSTANLIAHGTGITTISASQNVTKTLTGLSLNTTYYYKACAENGTGISCGSVLSFKTAKPDTVSNTTNTTSSASQNTSSTSLISAATWATVIKSVIFLAILIIAIAIALRIFHSGH